MDLFFSDCTVRVDDVIVSDALNVSIDFDQEQIVKGNDHVCLCALQCKIQLHFLMP